MKKNQISIRLLSIAFLLCINVAAYAQAGPSPDAGPDGQMKKPPAPPFMQYEDQLRDTYTDLRITAAQQPIWQTYEDKVHALMTDLSQAKTPAPDNATALQKLQRQADIANDRLAALEEIVDAADALYAVLDTRQKTVADRRLAATVPPLYAEAGVLSSPDGAPPNAGAGGKRGRHRGAQ